MSEAEMTASHYITSALHSLRGHVEDFDAALAIFDHGCAQMNFFDAEIKARSLTGPIHMREQWLSERTELSAEFWRSSKWKFVAGRDGAITVYNFYHTLQGIISLRKQHSLLESLIDEEKLSEASKLLRNRFPRLEGVRTFVSHAAEFSRNEKKLREHAATTPQDAYKGIMTGMPQSLFDGGSFIGRTFTVTFMHKACSYELSAESVECLINVVRTCYSAFPQTPRSFAP